ncbi:MAG: monoheme cytochrome C [Flavobacteriales bacterium]|nr:monoheme cytochrome C [Flavobacteriales bacterium]
MLDPEKKKVIDEIERKLRFVVNTWLILMGVAGISIYVNVLYPDLSWSENEEMVTDVVEELPEFENGIHLATGFKEGNNLQLVIANCTGCHSSKMVTQNRATREGWKSMIRWMQETQNLWELGDGEDLILDYLAKYYAPEKKGRRQPLTDITWYELED